MGAILPFWHDVLQPSGKGGHAQFGREIGAGEMQHHAMVALARLGAVHPLDVGQLRRVLQPVFIDGLHLRDARIAVELDISGVGQGIYHSHSRGARAAGSRQSRS